LERDITGKDIWRRIISKRSQILYSRPTPERHKTSFGMTLDLPSMDKDKKY
jgi:hypothetical protein